MASSRSQPAARGRARSSSASSRPKRRRWWLVLLVLPVVMLAAVGLLLFYVVFSTVPLPSDIAAVSSVVFDRDGQEVGGIASEVAREDIALADLPPHVSQAVLAAEDRSFYEHRGISVTGIARALFTNVRSGSIQGGGSTITQQYLKYTALTPEQTYRRKVEEAALAIKLEREYSKDEILTFYLNTAYWGRGTSGIEAASRTYFEVPARELDVNQAATLAGLLPAPEAYDPLEHPDRAETRRRYVLDGMRSEGYITESDHERLVAAGLPEVTDLSTLDRGPNAYYLDAVRRELAARPEFAQGELFRGLRVHTQLDQRLQQAAQETLTAAVNDGPTDTGAIVTVDPAGGGVLAMVGGPDILEQQFNTAIRAVRQPGSTFKTFTLEGFFEQGYSPDSRFPAPPELEIDDAQQPIRNFGGSSFGEQTVRQATASSTNTVFVQMQEAIGRESVIDAARRAGLPRSKDDEIFPTERGAGETMRPLAGLTLGQDVFSPLELTSAYATYAAEGVHTTPHLITRVEGPEGQVLYEPEVRQSQDVDTEVSRLVTDVLRGVVTGGSGGAAALDDRPVAGKTGTTNDARDVWFVGYVPQLATTVWLGNLDNSPIEAESATGGGLAAPVWSSYMARAVDGLEVVDFTPPGELDLEALNEEPEACPDGYAFAEPPGAADEDGFFPDVLTDLTDDQGLPCVEVKPELDPCPEGYAFADRPEGPDEFGRTPQVLDDVTDFQGRPCVEVLGEPEPEEPEEPEQPEEPEEPEEPQEPEEPEQPEEPEDPGAGGDQGGGPGSG